MSFAADPVAVPREAVFWTSAPVAPVDWCLSLLSRNCFRSPMSSFLASWASLRALASASALALASASFFASASAFALASASAFALASATFLASASALAFASASAFAFASASILACSAAFAFSMASASAFSLQLLLFRGLGLGGLVFLRAGRRRGRRRLGGDRLFLVGDLHLGRALRRRRRIALVLAGILQLGLVGDALGAGLRAAGALAVVSPLVIWESWLSVMISTGMPSCASGNSAPTTGRSWQRPAAPHARRPRPRSPARRC